MYKDQGSLATFAVYGHHGVYFIVYVCVRAGYADFSNFCLCVLRQTFMPKLPCCTKASFYANSAFLLLTASLYANYSRTNYPLEVYTHNAAIGMTILRETFMPSSLMTWGCPILVFMTGSYPHPCNIMNVASDLGLLMTGWRS